MVDPADRTPQSLFSAVRAEILETAAQMFEDRGYSDVAVNDGTMCSTEAVLRILDPSADEAERVGIQHVRDAAQRHAQQRLILVSKMGPTAFLASALQKHSQVGDNSVEVFTFAQLRQNITHHRSVPRHVVVAPQAVAEVLRSHGIDDPAALPKLLLTDPVARYYQWPPGTVVRIFRCDYGDNGLAKRFEALRYVCAS